MGYTVKSSARPCWEGCCEQLSEEVRQGCNITAALWSCEWMRRGGGFSSGFPL